ncbi:ATP-binding protein [Yimella sp. cx-573]|nr:ATP-binding protein [Yimella sp. cx-573]
MTESDSSTADSWVRTQRLAFTTDSVPEVRRVLRADLAESLVPEDVREETETVVSELVANAILHGRPLPDGTIRVHWKVRPPRIEVEVSDGGGERSPQPKPQMPWANSGRGLRIVRALAHEWGVNDDDGRTTVWAAMGGPSRRRV